MLKKHLAIVVLAAAGVWMGSSAQAAMQLVEFAPQPISSGVPEFSWTGPGGNFVDDVGSHYNPLAAPAASGLQIDTPLTITPLIPGETTNINTGSSSFANSTLVLTSSSTPGDFQDNGAGIFANQWFQSLTKGSFTITAQDGTLLLAGDVSGNFFGSALSSSSAGFNGQTVVYTGGLIYNALLSNGGNPSGGSMSVSMTTTNGNPIGVTDLGGGSASVSAFSADANGEFDVAAVPEPASLGALALVGMFASRRRRA